MTLRALALSAMVALAACGSAAKVDHADAAIGADGDSAAMTCGEMGASDGGPTLDDLQVTALDCTRGAGVFRWAPCAGSVLVVIGVGVDCDSWTLYDGTTKAWQASGGGCNGLGRCYASVPGFVFPSACFDGTIQPVVTNLCTIDGGVGITEAGAD
jgi:hypothetical protein